MAIIDLVTVPVGSTLEEYASYTNLQPAVRDLRAAAHDLVPRLADRTIWMISSTAQGGGVAEMMPGVISLLRQLGAQVEWVVIAPDDERFFRLTKHLHNLLHGTGDPNLSDDDRAFYNAISSQLAEAFREQLKPNDLLVVHDPQPLGMGALLRQQRPTVRAVWRCHIGLDRQNAATRAAWAFVEPWVRDYDRAIFSLEAYVPPFLSGQAEIMYPTIDPLSEKNQGLSTHRLTGILINAALTANSRPSLIPPFAAPALRLQPDGTFALATQPEDLDLLFRPIVAQVSRWDHLKGFAPLLQGFVRLKQEQQSGHTHQRSAEHEQALELVRLVLAGPDPSGVQDDPEAIETLQEICDQWLALDATVQRDIAVIKLPMISADENALMVNALQRCSSIVAQNSLQEGFGLTATEAMWKATPILGTQAAGIRAQVRDGIDGRLVRDPENPEEIAATLDEMLTDEQVREVWGRNAQERVAENYLVFTQVRRWLEVLAQLTQN